MSGAETYHRSCGLEIAVEEHAARAEAVPEGAVDRAGERMLA